MIPDVRLVMVIRQDVERMGSWLRDGDVSASWYGTDGQGEAFHIGYLPRHMVEATPWEWNQVFRDDDRKIFSVLTSDGEHIGEGQMAIDRALSEAQLFILIGRKDLWYKGYGTAALLQMLGLAFDTYGLHRAWVDVPEYNLPARHMCERIGFLTEGRFREAHPKDGLWHDSVIMGLLYDEFARRRAGMMEARELAAA